MGDALRYVELDGRLARVAIQGRAQSFHDQAARQLFGAYEPLYCDSFAETLAALKHGADYALCAVENTLAGPIAEALAAIRAAQHIEAVDEMSLTIDQQLIGFAGTPLAAIREVYSHPAALKQCAAFLARELPQARAIAAADTAGSVMMIKNAGKPTSAAIASAAAARANGMAILARDIADCPPSKNVTRFVLLRKAAAHSYGRSGPHRNTPTALLQSM